MTKHAMNHLGIIDVMDVACAGGGGATCNSDSVLQYLLVTVEQIL